MALFSKSFQVVSYGPFFGLKKKSFWSWSRILTSFWRPLGTLLGPFWETFGVILGTFWQHVWKVVLASIFDAFSMRLNLAFLILVEAKMHFSHFRQGRCWHRFWLPKASQNGPKTVPRRSQEGPKGFSKSLLKMHAFRKGKKLEKSNFRKFRRPILSQHGSQEGSQEASKIGQKTIKNRLSFGLALGRPSGPQKVSKNDPKMVQNHPN